jgi:biopolymer transport protein ExbB/TolQ
MLTWIAIKVFFKKSWSLLKNYWYVPVSILFAIFIWRFFRKETDDKLLETLRRAETNYKKEIKIINETHKEEIEKRNKILTNYQKTVAQIEEEYEKKNEKLSEREKKTVKKLAKKYSEDPVAYTKEIANRFGFKYIEKT